MCFSHTFLTSLPQPLFSNNVTIFKKVPLSEQKKKKKCKLSMYDLQNTNHLLFPAFKTDVGFEWNDMTSGILTSTTTAVALMFYLYNSSSFLGSTAQLRPWPPPQNLAEFLGGFSTIFFFTG
jgi:hypothetical protein